MLEYVIKDLSEMSDEAYKRSFLCMHDARKAKVKRFQNEISKKSTLAGEWLVRCLLSNITGEAAESFIISVDERGKPYLENVSALFFNISHSGSKVVAAICDKSVGVDIEMIRPVSLKLAKKVCTPEELLYVFGCLPEEPEFENESKPESIRRFLEIWTAKEAYFKCIGTGITDFKNVQSLSADYRKIKIENDAYMLHIVTPRDKKV